MSPPLSVVMPVLNARPFLDAAVESILAQSFGEFEFVIFDDGSTDGSTERLSYWAARDSRIRLFGGKERLGPVGSSNRVVKEARAPLIARMDADDIARRDRFASQIKLLEEEPDAVLVASVHITIDENGRLLREADFARLLRQSRFAPFVHSGVTFRRPAFDAAGGYRAGSEWWEDVDLYLRLVQHGRALVLTQPLTGHRITSTSTRVASRVEDVVQAYDRLYHSIESPGRSQFRDGKIAPAAYPLLGSVSVWAGRRPRLFPLLLRQGRLRKDWKSALALIWTAWADLEPRSLRKVLRCLLSGRNRRARRKLADRPWVEWRPPST